VASKLSPSPTPRVAALLALSVLVGVGCTSISTTCGVVDGGGFTGGGGDQGGIGGAIPAGDHWIDATTNLVGLVSECGTVSTVSARPDRDMVIVGIAQRGLWASTNDASDWTQLGTGAGSATIVNRTTDVVYDPSHPDTFWEAGIYNSTGVYRTDDNGTTFIALGDSQHNDSVSVDFTDPDRKTLLAGSHETERHILHSSDGGKTWTDIGTNLPAGLGYSSQPFVLDAITFLLGTTRSAMSGVFRSVDAGMNWARVFMGGTIGLPLSAHDGTLYFLLENNAGVIASTDKGMTWSNVGGANKVITNHGGASLVEAPDGRLISLGDGFVVISADHGATWRQFGPALPFNPSGMMYAPFRKAVYIWHFDCSDHAPVSMNSIMRLSFDYAAH
jgi:photosystem II stability/assembly factor-like uncharacterized protein